MYRPNQAFHIYQQQQFQQPMCYSPQNQYIPPQQMNQQFRPVMPPQYQMAFQPQQMPYDPYQGYQEPMPMGYHQQVVPWNEKWQRDVQQMPIRPQEQIGMHQPPMPPQRKGKPNYFRPVPQPVVQPKPVVPEPVTPKRETKLEFNLELPKSPTFSLQENECPGSFNIIGRGNLPSINFNVKYPMQ